MKLKQFGHGGIAADHGITIDHLQGWLESLIQDEEENVTKDGPKQDRLNKAYDALQLLTEISE